MEHCLTSLTPFTDQVFAGYLQDNRLAMIEAPVESPRAVLADELPHLTPAAIARSAAPFWADQEVSRAERACQALHATGIERASLEKRTIMLQ